jgi:hypothetical protein
MDPVLTRHPVVGKDGLMTREWLRFQNQIQAHAAEVPDITQNITDIQTGSSFDDTCVRDFQPAIWEAFLQDQESTHRDFGPAIQDAQLSLAADSPRVYDDSELRNAAAGLDVPNTPGFEQQIDELRNLIASLDTPRGGATGTFTSADGHTVTVQAGLIISIV